MDDLGPATGKTQHEFKSDWPLHRDVSATQGLAGVGNRIDCRDRGRTIFEVDLGRRIGFVGGQTGKRKIRPPARHVRLVLDENRVITAFPFVP